MKQRIIGFFGFNRTFGHIACGHIGPCVTIKANGAQMQESRLASAAHVVGGALGCGIGVIDIERVAVEIFESGAALKAGGDPAVGCWCGDAYAVVFTDK